MKMNHWKALVVPAIAMALMTGCATPSSPADETQVAAATPQKKCQRSEAQTGTSIVRRDCSSNPDVSTVDARELMDSRRVALPDAKSTR